MQRKRCPEEEKEEKHDLKNKIFSACLPEHPGLFEHFLQRGFCQPLSQLKHIYD